MCPFSTMSCGNPLWDPLYLSSLLFFAVTFPEGSSVLSDFITCIPFNWHTSPDLSGPCCLLGPWLLAQWTIAIYTAVFSPTAYCGFFQDKGWPSPGLDHTFPGMSHGCCSARVRADQIRKGSGSFHHLGLRCGARGRDSPGRLCCRAWEWGGVNSPHGKLWQRERRDGGWGRRRASR